MKIQNITFTHPKKQITGQITNKHILNTSVPVAAQPPVRDTVSFSGRLQELTPEQKLERALDIVQSFSPDQIHHMDDFDQKHLEGIQYGLKSFEGMSFREIYFLLSNMDELCMPLIRDCAGMCPVCAVNGSPKDRSAKNMIHKTDFEDYASFTKDLKKICERLGFDMKKNAISKMSPWAVLLGYKPLTSLFYDSDCKDIQLEDKDGKAHEFPELNKMLFEATGIQGIFDTAGWSPTNTKVQKRMEALADYYSTPKHQKEIGQINISLNTYHGIMEKANEFKNKGDFEGYNRLKAVYVKNIANAMYTFTPLMYYDKYQILAKAFNENEPSQFDDYKLHVLEQLKDEVLDALEKRYEEDLKNKNYKFVKNEYDISYFMYEIKSKCEDAATSFTPSARKNMFSKIPVDKKNLFPKNSALEPILKATDMLVDMNGKIYFKNDFQIFETDKSFNFKNKDKQTKQLYPVPEKRIISIKDRDFANKD